MELFAFLGHISWGTSPAFVVSRKNPEGTSGHCLEIQLASQAFGLIAYLLTYVYLE